MIRLIADQKRCLGWGLMASTPWFFVFSFLWLPPVWRTLQGLLVASAWMFLTLALCTAAMLIKSGKPMPDLVSRFMQLYLLLLSWNLVLTVVVVRVVAEPFSI